MNLRFLDVTFIIGQKLPKNDKDWCSCKEHNSRDFTKVNDFYCMHFIPNGWALDCKTIDTTNDDRRALYLIGYCSICGGFMRKGTSLPVNFSGDNLLKEIYREMKKYRPYDGKRADGSYNGGVLERSKWYEVADKLPEVMLNALFLSLFKEKDKAMVQLWLNNKAREAEN